MGMGHLPTNCSMAFPCELRPLWAASPGDNSRHSHVPVWRTALFLTPAGAEEVRASHFHLCAGAKHNRRRCLFFRLPGQQDFLPRYGASPRSSAPAPQICIKGDFFKKRRHTHKTQQKSPKPSKIMQNKCSNCLRLHLWPSPFGNSIVKHGETKV